MSSSKECIELEAKYSAHNYHPLPVVFSEAEGVIVKDPEGNEYYDFLSAYSAVNQGHSHPKIIDAMVKQAKRCSLSSRAFYNDMLGKYARYITEYFGYGSVLPMNTGAEGVETALKIARKWGYVKKGIPEDEAIIVACEGNFHGRTIAIVSMSTDPDCRKGFGPFLPNMHIVPYSDIDALKKEFETYGDRIAGLLLEPIQGEAGINIPKDGYLKEAAALCKQHNILFIDDEIQTGLARTGKLLAVDYEDLRPDILILGKALSGGLYPVSAVLADTDIMDVIGPGEHGSTYGGNPVACATAIAALEVIKDENLAKNAFELGEYFRGELVNVKAGCPMLKEFRGRGLLNALVIHPMDGKSAWEVCLLLKSRGLLAKPTHDHIIRLAPPLVITKEQLDACIDIIKSTLTDIVSMRREDIPGIDM